MDISKGLRLENWSAGKDMNDPYQAPETLSLKLQGNVYNHPNFRDGDRVCTSSVVEVSARIVQTSSGSIYYLGEPNPKYLEYLKSIDYPFDPKNPIKVKS
jgi:hypothetical protein